LMGLKVEGRQSYFFRTTIHRDAPGDKLWRRRG
jgi:hypothetical protein